MFSLHRFGYFKSASLLSGVSEWRDLLINSIQVLGSLIRFQVCDATHRYDQRTHLPPPPPHYRAPGLHHQQLWTELRRLFPTIGLEWEGKGSLSLITGRAARGIFQNCRL